MTFEYKGRHTRAKQRWFHFFRRAPRNQTQRDTPIVAELRAAVADEAGRKGERVVISDIENPA